MDEKDSLLEHQWCIQMQVKACASVGSEVFKEWSLGCVFGSIQMNQSVLQGWFEDVLRVGHLGRSCYTDGISFGGWTDEVDSKKAQPMYRAHADWLHLSHECSESIEQGKIRSKQWQRVEDHELLLNEFKRVYADALVQSSLGIQLQNVLNAASAKRTMPQWEETEQIVWFKSLRHQWQLTEERGARLKSTLLIECVSKMGSDGRWMNQEQLQNDAYLQELQTMTPYDLKKQVSSAQAALKNPKKMNELMLHSQKQLQQLLGKVKEGVLHHRVKIEKGRRLKELCTVPEEMYVKGPLREAFNAFEYLDDVRKVQQESEHLETEMQPPQKEQVGLIRKVRGSL